MAVTREQVLAKLHPDEPRYDQAAAQLGPEALPHLMQIVLEGDPGLADKATSLAGVIDDAGSVEVLVAAYRSPDPGLRVVAAAALARLSELPISLAESMLNDKDVGVRKLTLRALAYHKPTGVKHEVQDIAENDPNVALQEMASRVVDQLP